MSDLVLPIKVFERETTLSASSHPYTLDLLRCKTRSHSNSFIPCTASLWTVLREISIPASSSPELFSCFHFLLVTPYQYCFLAFSAWQVDTHMVLPQTKYIQDNDCCSIPLYYRNVFSAGRLLRWGTGTVV